MAIIGIYNDNKWKLYNYIMTINVNSFLRSLQKNFKKMVILWLLSLNLSNL